MEKYCPRCGKAFNCEHSADCWCATMHLSDDVKGLLKANYNDCLCKDCIEEITKNNEV